jgi:hypothetical protein
MYKRNLIFYSLNESPYAFSRILACMYVVKESGPADTINDKCPFILIV